MKTKTKEYSCLIALNPKATRLTTDIRVMKINSDKILIGKNTVKYDSKTMIKDPNYWSRIVFFSSAKQLFKNGLSWITAFILGTSISKMKNPTLKDATVTKELNSLMKESIQIPLSKIILIKKKWAWADLDNYIKIKYKDNKQIKEIIIAGSNRFNIDFDSTKRIYRKLISAKNKAK